MEIVGVLILVVALLAAFRGLGEVPVVDDEGTERLEAQDALRRISEKDEA